MVSNNHSSRPTENSSIQAGMENLNIALDFATFPLKAIDAGINWACQPNSDGNRPLPCRVVESIVQPVVNVASRVASSVIPNSVSSTVNNLPQTMERNYGVPQSTTSNVINNIGILGGAVLGGAAIKGVCKVGKSFTRNASSASSSVATSRPINAPSTAPSSVPSTTPSSIPSVAPNSAPSVTPSSAPYTAPTHALPNYSTPNYINTSSNHSFPAVPGTTNFHQVNMGNQGVFKFHTTKGTDGSMTAFVDYLSSTGSASIGEGTATAGSAFRALSILKNYASQQGANQLFVQWQPANQRLFQIAKNSSHLTYMGKAPPLGGNLAGFRPSTKFPMFKINSYKGDIAKVMLAFVMANYGGFSAFADSIQMNGLSDGYNDCNPDSPVSDGEGSSGDIGGVGNQVGQIENLFQSYNELKDKSHLFYLPTINGKLLFTEQELMQIIREVACGIYSHDTVGYFSLHFNLQMDMYPVLHPALQNTSVGGILSELDYYMKGFLNGGFFDEKFIKEWQTTKTYSPAELKTRCIDMREYCLEHLGPSQPYFSTHELLDRIKEVEAEDQHKDRIPESPILSDYSGFRSSFRIIAKQNSIQKADNLFIPDGDFDVFYTIEPDAVYKEELEKFRALYGKDPEGYKRLVKAYDIMQDQVKNIMPRLPKFQELFEKLKLINFFSYYFRTLKAHQKVPLFAPMEVDHSQGCFPLFPALPIRRIHHQNMQMNALTLMNMLSEAERKKIYDFLFSAQLDDFSLPQDILNTLEIAFKRYIKQLSTVSLTDEHLKNKKYTATIQELLKFLTLQVKYLKDLKIIYLKKLLEEQKEINAASEIEANQALSRLSGFIQTYNTQKGELRNIINYYDPYQINKAIGELDVEISKCNSHINSINAQLTAMKQRVAEIEEKIRFYSRDNIAPTLATVEIYEEEISPFFEGISYSFEFVLSVLQLMQELPQELRSQTKRIVGGCGLNLQSMPILFNAEAKQILNQAVDAIRDSSAEILIPFSNDNQAKNPEGYLFKLNFRNFASCDNTDYHFLEFSLNDESPETALYKADIFNALYEGDIERFKKGIRRKDCLNAVDSRGISLLHYAARQEDPRFLREMLAAGANKNLTDAFGMTLLHYAAQEGSIAVMKLLCEKDLSLLNVRAKNGATALHMAVESKQVRAIDFLLSYTATLDVNCKMNNGMTPLYCAIHHKLSDIALMLLNNSQVDVNLGIDNGNTPLHLAVDLNLPEIVKVLIQKGADVNQARLDSYTALHLAAKQGKKQLCLILLGEGKAAVNSILKSGKTALHLSVTSPDATIVSTLLEYGASLSIYGWQRSTPFNEAIQAGNLTAVKQMIAQAAQEIDPQTHTKIIDLANGENETPLQIALRGRQWRVIEMLLAHNVSISDIESLCLELCRIKADPLFIIKIIENQSFSLNTLNKIYQEACKAGHNQLVSLLRKKPGLDFKDAKGWTPIHYAAKFDHTDVMRSFLKSPIQELLQKDQKGQTLIEKAAQIAAQNGSKRSLKLLLDTMKKIGISLRNQEDTHLLGIAIESDQEECAELIIRYMPLLNVSLNSAGDYAGHFAARNGDVEMMDFLRRQGTDFKIANKNHQTVFHIAFEYEKEDLITYLMNEKYEFVYPFDLMCSIAKSASPKFLKSFVKKGHRPDPVTSRAKKPTPLFDALEENRLDNFMTLIQLGVNWNRPNIEGNTPLHLAAYHGQLEFVNFILSQNDSLDQTNHQGQTALHLACQQGNEDCVRSLLTRGFGKDVKDKQGLTPVDYAKQKGLHNISLILEGKEKELREKKAAVICALEMGNELAFFQEIKGLSLNTCQVFEIQGKKINLPLLHLFYRLPVLKKSVKPLLKKFLALSGVDPLTQDAEGCTIYHLRAIQGKKPPIAKYLALQDKQGKSVLHYYACFAKPHIFELAVNQSQMIIDLQDKKGITPLFEAIQKAKPENVALLLKNGANPNHKTKNGWTPLASAIKRGQALIVKHLLQFGADVDQHYLDKRRTPLHLAIEQKDAVITRLLISYGANLNAQDVHGIYPIQLAAKQGDLSGIRLLESSGTALNVKDFQGNTVAHYGAYQNKPELFQYFQEKEIPIHKPSKIRKETIRERFLQENGKTALHIAAEKGNLKTLKWLKENGSDVKALVEERKGVLFYAALSNRIEVLQFFDMNILMGNTVQRAQAIFAIALNDRIDMLKMFYQPGIPYDAYLDENGTTALACMALYNARKCAHFLVQGGASPHKPNLDGKTPFEIAIRSHYLSLVRYFSKYSEIQDIHKKIYEGKTYLHLACEGKDPEMAAWLIELGISIDETDSHGWTALHYAVKAAHYPLVHLLLACGGDLSKKTGEGQTALDLLPHDAPVLRALVFQYQQAHRQRLENQESCLHLAVRLNDELHFPLLVRIHDLDQRNTLGQTALDLAAKLSRKTLVPKLLERGMYPEYETE